MVRELFLYCHYDREKMSYSFVSLGNYAGNEYCYDMPDGNRYVSCKLTQHFYNMLFI